MCDHNRLTKELIERAHQGDKEARDQLITQNMGLIWSIVRRFAGRGCEVEDLFQIGSIGLIKAVDKFDTSFDVMFSTYAVPMITGEIKRFLRDDGMIKVSRSLKENVIKVQRAREQLQKEIGEEPNLNEISQRTEIPVEDIVMALEAGCEVESIYKTIYQSDGNEIMLVDKIADTSSTSSDHLVNRIVLRQVMEDLPEKERKLIAMRYFGDKTQMQVAKELGISQVQVSRTEKKILTRLREKIV